MEYSTAGFPVHHQLQEFTQTHVRRVGDAIQTSHPPLSPSPPNFNLSPGDSVLIPGLGRFPGEANGNLLQYPCLENLMDTGAWWAAVHGVAKSWARLSD